MNLIYAETKSVWSRWDDFFPPTSMIMEVFCSINSKFTLDFWWPRSLMEKNSIEFSSPLEQLVDLRAHDLHRVFIYSWIWRSLHLLNDFHSLKDIGSKHSGEVVCGHQVVFAVVLHECEEVAEVPQELVLDIWKFLEEDAQIWAGAIFYR